MPTLNYTTAVPAQRTVAQPQDLLAQKGAIDVQAICRGPSPRGYPGPSLKTRVRIRKKGFRTAGS